MFLRMGSVATKPGRSPARLKVILDSLSPVVPSLSEALQPFSAVLVTGGSSGIGKSFIQLGQKLKPDLVFCNLSRRSPAENIFPNSEKRLNHFPCDLSQSAEVERVAGALRDFLGRNVPKGQVLLINNSGFGTFGAFPELDLKRELQMIDLNVGAVVHLTGLLLPMLRARSGAIINLASTVAFQPTPFAATYGATKAFVLHWTLALNEELRGSGVRAIALCPGTTRTGFFRTAGLDNDPVQSWATMTADQVATAGLHALASARSQVVPGLGNKLYTFAGAKLPKPVAARIAGKVLGRRRPESRRS
jgi:short-subunit dehydrogenase